jgi:hypothetical protein
VTNETDDNRGLVLARGPAGPLPIPRDGAEFVLEPVPTSPSARSGRLTLHVQGLRNERGRGDYTIHLVGSEVSLVDSVALYLPAKLAEQGTDFVLDLSKAIDDTAPTWRANPHPLRLIFRPGKAWVPPGYLAQLTLLGHNLAAPTYD